MCGVRVRWRWHRRHSAVSIAQDAHGARTAGRSALTTPRQTPVPSTARKGLSSSEGAVHLRFPQRSTAPPQRSHSQRSATRVECGARTLVDGASSVANA